METVFYILVGGSVLVGSVLALYGAYGLIVGRIHGFDRASGQTHELTGSEARRAAFYYFVAGAIWVSYALFRLFEGP